MEPLHFSDITKAEHYKQPIAVQTTVSGKSLVPYGIPYEFVVQCTTPRCDCNFKDQTYLRLEPYDDNLLKFIDKPETHFSSVVRKIYGVHCKHFSFDVITIQNVERIFITEPIGKDKSKDNTIKTAFYTGHGIEINQPYLLSGYQSVDPKDQSVTWVFNEAERVNTAVDAFNIKEHISELCAFQKNTSDAHVLMNHLQRLYNTYSRNVTEIYHRFDLHLAVDLVFKSVISFKFGKENIPKGWLDVMLLGDTRSGKGYVAEGLVKYFGFGEVVSVENATYAGLVAGLQQFQKHWCVTWGKIPMNDKGLLVIDESGNLKEDWAKLSRIRSEGIAEITKIHTQQTMARTRLIWLSNPIKKFISNFSYGVQALLDVIDHPEDISRFDYALVCAHEEIDIEKINMRKPAIDWMYPKELERDLVRWVWSRKHDQVHFTEEAIDFVYEVAIHMGKTFDFSIPLVQGENVRVKIAKLAVCLAARFFSTNKEGTHIVVKKVHVQAAWVVFHGFYSKTANGYMSYSKLKRTQQIKEEDFVKVQQYFSSYKLQEGSIYDWLLNVGYIDGKDLKEYLGGPQSNCDELLSLLIRTNCIQKRGNSYIKTSSFNQWLRGKVLGDKPINADTL